MRRLVVLLTLLALAIPFAAGAAVRTPGDGTLSVRDLDGYIRVRATGAVIGHCDRCLLYLNEQVGADVIVPVVQGAKGSDTDFDDSNEKFGDGKRELRWKVVGGSFNMVVRNGSDVDLSVVGRGRVWVYGTKGSYSINGGPTLNPAPGPPSVQFPLSTLPQ
jgi:hypothetical protein